MTFSLQAVGSKDQVRRQLAATLAKHVEWKNDPAQPQAVIDLVAQHLAVSDYPGGLFVESSGHLDKYSGSLQLSIRPLNIPAEPAPDA